MSEGFKHPKVKVHVGDGFKFLDDYKNTFDVIITDSSDPEGPAESLFQKPYFQLMHDALREGGVITTQGCTFPSRPWNQALETCSRRPYSVPDPLENENKNKKDSSISLRALVRCLRENKMFRDCMLEQPLHYSLR